MSPRPFLFGKLPAHGDFVARGMSDADRDAWDAWGSLALGALRAAAGEGFEAAHVAAPPWRFVTRSPDGWRAGALAPSIDAVGRRFLLALGVDGLDQQEAGACGLPFADLAEGLIYDALAQAIGADALLACAADRFGAAYAAAADAARTLAASPAAAGVWWTLGSGDVAPCAVASAQAPHDLFARTLAGAGSSHLETVR